ncbi:acyltransferase family protein [uncultured Cohaesibacter sp.]|uniref:acyltransferase family protein n=1 Tax=uncultured Cohaesibacter sp. TaxID=1002546 RepID=UPI002AA668A4|nr:acyltransferase family protein [uncultured Cohaesibacter sp.]
MAATSKRVDYRPDIDGLRAIAVISVFLYHLNFSFIPGGFVGVDVFYVISGYVILKGLVPGIMEKRFSLISFYDRRIRRIYPALILVVALCLLVGYFVMTPKEFVSLAETSAAALFSGSNIYFHDRLGYFAAAGNTLPLLHTWSLGVEFQFYLLIPLLLLAAGRMASDSKKAIVFAMLAVIAVSFCINVFSVFVLFDTKFAFYMPMARFWEICLGGLIACWDNRFNPSRALSNTLIYVAIAGLVASFTLIDQNVSFPGIAVLLPVLATSILVLVVPRNDSIYNSIVTFPPAQFFGRISYSLYLFHWPMIVFPTLYLGRDLAIWEKIIVFLLATGVSFVSWKFVETPLRCSHKGSHHKQVVGGIGATVAVLCFVTATVVFLNGIPQRLSPGAQVVYRQITQNAAPDLPCEPVDWVHDMGMSSIASCQNENAAGMGTFLLWGDSHAGMLWPDLQTELSSVGMNGILAVMAECPALLNVHTAKYKNREECAALREQLLKIVQSRKIDLVVLSSRWGNYSSDLPAPGDGGFPVSLFDDLNHGRSISFKDALLNTVQRFTSLGARVLVVGPVPEINYNVPEMLVRSTNLDFPMPAVDLAKFEMRQANTLEALKMVSKIEDAKVVYPSERLCPERSCKVVVNKKPLYIDDDHLSNFGVDVILPDILSAMRASEKATK